MTTLIALLLLILAALVTLRLRSAEREADYWRAQALNWQSKYAGASLEVRSVCEDALRFADEVRARRQTTMAWLKGQGEN